MFDVKNVLNVYYGIDSTAVSPQQGGWSALAYKAAGGGADYFLKAYDKKRASTAKLTALIDVYAPIIQWLNHPVRLKGSVPVPVLTKDGAYKCEDDHGIYLLYEYIDGETIGDRPLYTEEIEKLAQIIATLHSYGENIPVDTGGIKENFDVPFVRQMRSLLSEGLPGEAAELIGPHTKSIRRAIETVEELSHHLKNADLKLALCHTDLHNWNLMKTGRELVLIDWDGLPLAPVDADLMFFAEQPYFQEFLRVYRLVHVGFQINRHALRFYQVKRRLEDIWEFIEQLVFDRQTEREKAETESALKKELEDLETSND